MIWLCFLLLFYVPFGTATTEENLDINNKCTYTANRRILNCDSLENVNENLIKFLTSGTQMLIVRNSENVNLLGGNFTSSNDLISYQILNSHHFSAGTQAFGNLVQLKYIEIHGNIWREVKNYVFKNLHSLEILNLARNKIEKLNRKSFSSLNNLKTLDLSDNCLKTVPSHVFEELTNLESLYINNNLIANIQDDAFVGLSSLNILYMTNNSMTYVVTNNFNQLNSLEHLDISFNKIGSIINQLSLSKLKFVQLSNNELRQLNDDVFEKCSELASIDLSRNKLTSLTETPFVSLPKLRHLNLYNNFVNMARFENVKRTAVVILNNQ